MSHNPRLTHTLTKVIDADTHGSHTVTRASGDVFLTRATSPLVTRITKAKTR